MSSRRRRLALWCAARLKRVPIFSFATQGGKQASSYFGQRNWVPKPERLKSGSLPADG